MDGASVSIPTPLYESPRHVIPFGRRIAYSFGHVLNDLCASMWFSYLLIFLHNVLQLSDRVAGRLLLLGQIADGIATPFVGYESDKAPDFWFCKYGRRKAWHLLGTMCVIFSFPFIFMDCFHCSNSSQQARFIYYAAFIVIFQFGWASVQVSHLSLIPDLTPLSCERVELNSYRYAMTVLSNICTYSGMLVILGMSKEGEKHTGPKDLPVFRNVALSIVGVGAFFSLIFHAFTKEKEHSEFAIEHECSINDANQSVEKPHLRWKDWFHQPQFYMVALLYMGTRLYVNLSQIYMPLYIEDTLGLHKNKIAIIPLVVYVSGFIASFAVKFLRRLFGIKITYLLGCSLAVISCVWIYIGKGETYSNYQLYGVAVLVGVAGSTLLIISLAFTSDLIANSTTSSAFVFGSMSFVDKFANGITVVVIQDLHPCVTCCPNCHMFYKYVLVFACGGAVVLALIGLAFLSTQSIGKRRNEDKLHRNSLLRNSIRQSRKATKAKDEEKPLLLNDDSESNST